VQPLREVDEVALLRTGGAQDARRLPAVVPPDPGAAAERSGVEPTRLGGSAAAARAGAMRVLHVDHVRRLVIDAAQRLADERVAQLKRRYTEGAARRIDALRTRLATAEKELESGEAVAALLQERVRVLERELSEADRERTELAARLADSERERDAQVERHAERLASVLRAPLAFRGSSVEASERRARRARAHGKLRATLRRLLAATDAATAGRPALDDGGDGEDQGRGAAGPPPLAWLEALARQVAVGVAEGLGQRPRRPEPEAPGVGALAARLERVEGALASLERRLPPGAHPVAPGGAAESTAERDVPAPQEDCRRRTDGRRSALLRNLAKANVDLRRELGIVSRGGR
jgi:hypothetical protein